MSSLRSAALLTRSRARLAPALLALPFLASACAAPVTAVRVDAKVVQRELTGSVLTTGEPSRFTRNQLFIHGLDVAFAEKPAETLEQFRKIILAGQAGPGELCAAAELSFLHANATGDTAYYLAAAVYAWMFLFPDEKGAPLEPFDPRIRMAADLYNRSITLALASDDGAEVDLRSGTYLLPWGDLEVEFDRAQLRWAGRELTNFVPVSELKVTGLEARFRRPGIGAALAAGMAPVTEDQKIRDIVAPRLKVPATALLKFDDPRRRLEGGRMKATLALYTESEVTTVEIAGRTVPLELEPTAALAWTLQEAPPWTREFQGFLGNVFQVGSSPQLVSASPHRFGRIPVVFVHGTASSLGRWAEMLNVLQSDPTIHQRYEFWFFSYDSGQGIAYSSSILRDALTSAVTLLDPESKDPGLKQMVIIGHSQGGLLTKMMVIHSGTTLYDAAVKKPLAELRISEETRELVRRVAFFEPLPFVKKVIFMCTPHRGSYLAGPQFVGNVLRRLVSTPARLVKGTGELLANRDAFAMQLSGNRLATAVDNMSPNHPFVRSLQSIPIAPGVKAYSIIAVEGDGPFEAGDDGVVQYQSAHIDGVESELVVRWNHSVQGRPEAIAEVRRILLLDGAR